MKRIAIILAAALLCSFKVVPVKLPNGQTAYLPEGLATPKKVPIRTPFSRIPFVDFMTPRPFEEQARLSTILKPRRSWNAPTKMVRILPREHSNRNNRPVVAR